MRNLGRAMLRVARILEDLEPDERVSLARQIYTTVIGPLPVTEAERSARYRIRHAEDAGNRHDQAVTNGHCSSPSLLDSKDLEEASKDLVAKTAPKIRPHHDAAKRLLAFLNEKTGKSFRPVDTHLTLLEARLNDGATEANVRGVIARKCAEWLEDPKTSVWLRPSTLFRASNFENYLGERRVEPAEMPQA